MKIIKKLLVIFFLCCGGVVFAQSYQIGDVYTAPDGSRGIVYYLHPDGSGGWVVALNDASTGCTWGASTDVPGLANQNPSSYQQLLNDTAGYANTQTLRNYQNNSTTYAAGKVDFAHGWVLPSPAQLSMLYGQLPFIASSITGAGGTALAYTNYWCSAEYSASNAWCVEFGTNYYSGHFNNVAKTTSCRVRAVRSFSNTAVVYDTALTYLWSTGSTQPYINVSPAQTTTYTVTGTTEFGCSNTAEQTIIVGTGAAQTIYDTVCQGAGYEANGFTITEAETGTAGTLTRSRTLTTAGCSSNLTLQLMVKSPVAELVEATGCGSYIWNGVTYYESGNYTQTFTAANGCDSVVTLHLTVMPTLNLSHSPDTVVSACSSVTLWASGTDNISWTDAEGTLLGQGGTITFSPNHSSTLYLHGTSGQTTGTNMVYNGDFEQGNSGFQSDYYLAQSTLGTGGYAINTDVYNLWGTAHQYGYGGSGNYMIVDGANYANAVVWRQTINVQPNTTYNLSAQLVSIGDINYSTARVQFQINGTPLGSTIILPATLNQWQTFQAEWNSGTLTSAVISIIDVNTNGLGNDFGIDEIKFEPILPLCSVTDSIQIFVDEYAPLQVTVTVSNDTLCEGEQVTLQAESDYEVSVPMYPFPSVLVGDILCTDNSIVKPSQWPVAGKTAKGIVFYVDNTGEHGWAVHLQDQSTSVAWGGYGTDITTLTNYANSRSAITDLNGYSNTQRARAAGTAATYPAAYLADFANGWYLPAAGQLRVLFSELLTVNASLQTVGGTQFPMTSNWGYWSSTERNQSFMWYVTNTGIVTYNLKDYTARVRVIRAF